MPPPSLWLKTWPSVCQATQPTTMPPSPHTLSAYAWHHMHRLGFQCLGGPVLPRGLSRASWLPTAPHGMQRLCPCRDRTGRGEATAPPQWLLSLRTGQGQCERQSLVYFCRVAVVPLPQLSQSSLLTEAPALQAGEGSRQLNKIPTCMSSSSP